MSEIVDEFEVVELFLFSLLVKCSNVFKCHSAFLLIVQEDLLTKFYIYFIAIHSRGNLIFYQFFEMVIIFNNIFHKMFLFFTFDKQSLVLLNFDFHICYSWQLELILNVCLLHIMYHDQIDEMAQLSPT